MAVATGATWTGSGMSRGVQATYVAPPNTASNQSFSPVKQMVEQIIGETQLTEEDWQRSGFSTDSKATMSLPQLVQGENKTNLGTTLYFKLLLQDNFYTQEIAPIDQNAPESMIVEWDSITFDRYTPQVTPEEGAPARSFMSRRSG